jgi:hypothetical protein
MKTNSMPMYIPIFLLNKFQINLIIVYIKLNENAKKEK